jgi:phosphatidylserine/phosphatidylglycerophosphate/cardiolipin synthase-like enzyme
MSSQHRVTDSQRQQMIAEAAYFRAERRGFNGGDTVRDWYEAEAEIDAELRKRADGELVERIEEALEAAAKRLAAARRKIARLSSVARVEWERDLDKAAALRDALKPKLAELKEQGERAGRKLREQTEKIGADLAELMRRLDTKGKH